MKEPTTSKKPIGPTPEDRWHELVKDCEEGVLGCMILDPTTIDVVVSLIKSDDFANPYNGRLFEIICNLRDSGVAVEMRTLFAEVKKQGLGTVFSAAELAKLVGKVPHTSNADYFAAEVARLSGVQRIMNAAAKLLEQRFDTQGEPEKLIASFEARVQGVIRGDNQVGVKQIATAMQTVAKEHEEARKESRTPGIPSGFRDIDQLAAGWHPGHLVFIGGRMFMGKTAFATAIAIKQILFNRSVLFFSLEMTAEEVAERAAAAIGGIPFRRFSQGTIEDADVVQIRNDAAAIETAKFYISDVPDETVRSLGAKMKLHKAAHGLDIAIIDNIQLIDPEDPREKRHDQLNRISRQLKKIAKKLRVTIIVLSQLNADAEGEEPDDKSWAESKQMVRDADTAILMHRETKTSPECMLKFTKNRKGTPGKVFLYFDGAIQWFRDITEKDTQKSDKL
jgi:replicative DNA helicase